MWTLTLYSPTDAARDVPVWPGRVVVGRAAATDLVVPDHSVSRRHAEFFLDAPSGRLTLRDLGSTNGTRVNGERLESERTLWAGDQIRLGAIDLLVHFDLDSEPAPADFSTQPLVNGDGLALPPARHAQALWDATENTCGTPATCTPSCVILAGSWARPSGPTGATSVRPPYRLPQQTVIAPIRSLRGP
jgi:predicted component of type VI protein secretion system